MTAYTPILSLMLLIPARFQAQETTTVAISLGMDPSMPLRLCGPAVDAARAAGMHEEDQLAFMRGFRFGHLEALIGARTSLQMDPEEAPYAQGMKAGFRHQPKVLLSLADFGYTLGTYAGTYRQGFEIACFTAKGRKETWWVRFPAWLDGIPLTSGVPSQGLRLEGWLSPTGQYGHMGLYRRELVVHQIHPPKR